MLVCWGKAKDQENTLGQEWPCSIFIHDFGRKREFQKLSGGMAAVELGQIGMQGPWRVL